MSRFVAPLSRSASPQPVDFAPAPTLSSPDSSGSLPPTSPSSLLAPPPVHPAREALNGGSLSKLTIPAVPSRPTTPQPPPRRSVSPSPSRPVAHTDRLSPAPPQGTTPLPSPRPSRSTTPVPWEGEEATDDEEDDDDMGDELPDDELRRRYDDDEIERFLKVFARHVNEVTLKPEAAKSIDALAAQSSTEDEFFEAAEGPAIRVPGVDRQNSLDTEASMSPTEMDEPCDGEWVQLKQGIPSDPNLVSSLKKWQAPADWKPRSLFDLIAIKYLLPIVPPEQPHSTPFTLAAFKLTVQRLYLVLYPAYVPFALNLWDLASWKNTNKSAFWCLVYWVLWYRNLILPALVLRILYSLLRRKVLAYPTAAELRSRRKNVARAEEFGNALQARLEDDVFGLRDAWRMFRVVMRGKKKKVKEVAANSPLPSPRMFQSSTASLAPTERDIEEERARKEEEDFRRVWLAVLDQMANMHERIANIFLWRRPAASFRYMIALKIIFLMTAFLPAHILAKLVYLVIGVSFWFVIPIILAIPPQERRRLPPPFADAPTDAEYAMEIIGERVARGESVVATRSSRHKHRRRRQARKATKESATRARAQDKGVAKAKNLDVDWRKWRDRALKGWLWAEEGRRLMAGEDTTQPRYNEPPEPLARSDTQGSTLQTQTFPAQHSTAPGLLVLTSNALLFTPVLSSTIKIRIDLESIQGVKKTGRFGGLSIKYVDADGREKTERFRWISARDEVFARLVGWGKKRWMKV